MPKNIKKESNCASFVVAASRSNHVLDLALKLPINGTKFERPHNVFNYWQNLQKVNIHSNTDMMYNEPV